MHILLRLKEISGKFLCVNKCAQTHRQTQPHTSTHTQTHAHPHAHTLPHTHTHKRTPRHKHTRTDTLLQTHTDIDTQRQTRTQPDTHSLACTQTDAHKYKKNTVIPTQIQTLEYLNTHPIIFIDFTIGLFRWIQQKKSLVIFVLLVLLCFYCSQTMIVYFFLENIKKSRTKLGYRKAL